MKYGILPICLFLAALGAATVALGDEAPRYDLARIVATGGALTETIYALDFGDHVVAVDSTALWPPGVQKKPSIGYVRRLSAEGVLSVEPTLIVNSADAGPPQAVAQLKAAGVPVVELLGDVPEHRFAAVTKRVRELGAVLGVPAKGEKLAALIEQDLAAVRENVPDGKTLKGLFTFNPAGNHNMSGGPGTVADEMLKLLGAKNVVTTKGWKPQSREALIAAQPDFIIIASRASAPDWATAKKLLADSGLLHTPAGREQRVLFVNPVKVMAGGPRTGVAVLEIARWLYPEADFPAAASAPWIERVEAAAGGAGDE